MSEDTKRPVPPSTSEAPVDKTEGTVKEEGKKTEEIQGSEETVQEDQSGGDKPEAGGLGEDSSTGDSSDEIEDDKVKASGKSEDAQLRVRQGRRSAQLDSYNARNKK